MTEPETTCKGFEVNHLVKQYANADKPVLDDISFKVEHGSVLVVLGPSGSASRRCCAPSPVWNRFRAARFPSTIR